MSRSLAARAALATLAALSLSGYAPKERVANPEAACSLAAAQVTARRRLPTNYVASCDNIPEAEGLGGYYVLALLAHCREEVCGSTNMGWFAVKKTTGEVFEWDIADWKVGRPIADDR